MSPNKTITEPSIERAVATLPPVVQWYTELQENSGARARLRRCRSTIEALGEPAAVGLARRLGVLGERSRHDDHAVGAALDVARVLAHVTEHAGQQRVMQAAGWKQFPGDKKESDSAEMRPLLSEVRFRRLLTTPPGEPLVVAFIRLIRLLKGEANVTQLSNDFRNWRHPERGPAVRQQWAFDYYHAGDSAPLAPTIAPIDEGDNL